MFRFLFVLIASALVASASDLAVSQNALSTTAESISAAGSAKLSVTVKNTDASIVIYLGAADTVTSSNGYPLAAGQSVEIKTTAAIFAIAASGTPSIAIITVTQ